MMMLFWLSRKSFMVITPIIEGGFFGRSRNNFLWEKYTWPKVPFQVLQKK